MDAKPKTLSRREAARFADLSDRQGDLAPAEWAEYQALLGRWRAPLGDNRQPANMRMARKPGADIPKSSRDRYNDTGALGTSPISKDGE